MEKRGLFACNFERTKELSESIKLVEWRVERGVSDEPLEDLSRLIEHYQNTFQWHKANAASRQMLALADGASTKFELLPEDQEVQEARLRLFRHKLNHQAFPLSLLTILMICLLLAAQAQLMAQPPYRYSQAALVAGGVAAGFWETAKARLFPNDLEVRLASVRSSFYHKRFAEALWTVNGILRDHPNSSAAYELKALVLRDADELLAALATVEKVDHYYGYYDLKQSILFRLGRYKEAADVAEAYVNTAVGGTADACFDASIKRRYASQFARSLYLARKGTAIAKNEAEMARGLAMQAYLLADPNSVIVAANEAIRLREAFLDEQEGRLTNYERFCSGEAFEAYLHRGNAYLQKGDLIAALKDLTLYLNERRWSGYVFQQRAEVYELLGQQDKANMDRRYADMIEIKDQEYATKSYAGKDHIFRPR